MTKREFQRLRKFEAKGQLKGARRLFDKMLVSGVLAEEERVPVRALVNILNEIEGNYDARTAEMEKRMFGGEPQAEPPHVPEEVVAGG